MKFIYRTLFLTIGLISSTACSDFLDQDSPSEMSDKVVFDISFKQSVWRSDTRQDILSIYAYCCRIEYRL